MASMHWRPLRVCSRSREPASPGCRPSKSTRFGRLGCAERPLRGGPAKHEIGRENTVLGQHVPLCHEPAQVRFVMQLLGPPTPL